MTQDLPTPLTSAEMDMRDLDGFMLNVVRLFSSELWALTKEKPEAFRGAVALWAKAWKQIPPASLPNDDSILAPFADMPLAKFKKLRHIVMRGFVECTDGRLYNKTLAEEVNRVWPSVAKTRAAREADKERLKQWRERKRNGGETPSETDGETGTKRVSSGIERDRDRDRDTENVEEESSLRSDIDRPPSPISNSAKLTAPKPVPKKRHEPEGFATFYAEFPRKVARGAAVKAYVSALTRASPETIFDGACRYAESRRDEDQNFTAHPATWLNQDRWLDEEKNDRSTPGNGRSHAANGRRNPMDSSLRGAELALEERENGRANGSQQNRDSGQAQPALLEARPHDWPAKAAVG